MRVNNMLAVFNYLKNSVSGLLPLAISNVYRQHVSHKGAIRNFEDTDSVLVPFNYIGGCPSQILKIAFVCHCYHPELFASIRAIADRVPGQANILLTTDNSNKSEHLARLFDDWVRGDVSIKVIQNIGRDIPSKIIAFNQEIRNCDLVVFMHTKQDTHSLDGNLWREYLIKCILGSTPVCESIIDAFQRNPILGIVIPNHYLPSRPWVRFCHNYDGVRKLAKAMGLNVKTALNIEFPSGSMFWARPAALDALWNVGLQMEDLPNEPVPHDGTILHAIERSFLLSCEAAGLKWIRVLTKDEASEKDRVYSIDSELQLSAYIDAHPTLLKRDVRRAKVQ